MHFSIISQSVKLKYLDTRMVKRRNQVVSCGSLLGGEEMRHPKGRLHRQQRRKKKRRKHGIPLGWQWCNMQRSYSHSCYWVLSSWGVLGRLSQYLLWLGCSGDQSTDALKIDFCKDMYVINHYIYPSPF